MLVCSEFCSENSPYDTSFQMGLTQKGGPGSPNTIIGHNLTCWAPGNMQQTWHLSESQGTCLQEEHHRGLQSEYGCPGMNGEQCMRAVGCDGLTKEALRGVYDMVPCTQRGQSTARIGSWLHLLGKVTGALWRIQDLVVEDREVEGKAEANRVSRGQIHEGDVLHCRQPHLSM